MWEAGCEYIAGMHEDDQHSLQKTREEINLSRVETLLTDASVALTFISIAEQGNNKETVERNIRNARTAYDSIQGLRPKYVLSDAQALTKQPAHHPEPSHAGSTVSAARLVRHADTSGFSCCCPEPSGQKQQVKEVHGCSMPLPVANS